MKKLVAVLGGGHGAHVMVVDSSSRGFSVNMYEMPRHREKFAVNSRSTKSLAISRTPSTV